MKWVSFRVLRIRYCIYFLCTNFLFTNMHRFRSSFVVDVVDVVDGVEFEIFMDSLILESFFFN